MPHRRDFLKTLAAGAAGSCVTSHGLGHASSWPRLRARGDG